MDYIKKIDIIIQKLEKSMDENSVDKINSLKDAASVGSELLMSVTHELLILINSNKNIYDLIGEDVLELKNYCWSIGLFVK